MRSAPHTVIGIGELLWDIFPRGRQLGGAPANFARSITLLGDKGIIASRVGADGDGREALRLLEQNGVDTGYVQVDDTRPTGTVVVRLDDKGQPDFTITEGSAWDFLEWTPRWERLAREADAVCFGSLAQRSARSRATINRFIEATGQNAAIIFDVNLRQAFYSAEVLEGSLELAHIAKLNEAELPEVTGRLGLAGASDEARMRSLMEAYGLSLVCVTRGDRGSILMTASEKVKHDGISVRVADTVGAGDAFTAALVHHYLRRAGLETMSEAANLMGALVASRAGAMPAVEDELLDRIRAVGGVKFY